MTPGKPKINAPGQKMAQAQAIRMRDRPDFSIIMTPHKKVSTNPDEGISTGVHIPIPPTGDKL